MSYCSTKLIHSGLTLVALACVTALIASCSGKGSAPHGTGMSDFETKACTLGTWQKVSTAQLNIGGTIVPYTSTTTYTFTNDGNYTLAKSYGSAGSMIHTYTEGTWTIANGALETAPTKSGRSLVTADDAKTIASPVADADQTKSVQSVVCSSSRLATSGYTGGDIRTLVGSWRSMSFDDEYQMKDGSLSLSSQVTGTLNLSNDGKGTSVTNEVVSYSDDRWLATPETTTTTYNYCVWSVSGNEFKAKGRDAEDGACDGTESERTTEFISVGSAIGLNPYTKIQ